MFWVSKVIAPVALVLGIAGTTAFVMADGDDNQPPFEKGQFGKGQPGKGFPGKGGDDKKGEKGDKKGEEKKAEEKKGQPGDKKGPGAPPKADPVVDAWLAVLLTKITDPHDTVRDSARGAVVSVGPPALPALQKLADGDDPAKAVAARKMIAAIHGHHGPGGQQLQPGRPGMGGPFGAGGPPGMGGRGFGGFPGGPGGMGPMGPGGRGPGGMGPMGPGGRGGPGGGERKGGRDEERDIEVAPMPRDAVSR